MRESGAKMDTKPRSGTESASRSTSDQAFFFSGASEPAVFVPERGFVAKNRLIRRMAARLGGMAHC